MISCFAKEEVSQTRAVYEGNFVIKCAAEDTANDDVAFLCWAGGGNTMLPDEDEDCMVKWIVIFIKATKDWLKYNDNDEKQRKLKNKRWFEKRFKSILV